MKKQTKQIVKISTLTTISILILIYFSMHLRLGIGEYSKYENINIDTGMVERPECKQTDDGYGWVCGYEEVCGVVSIEFPKYYGVYIYWKP